MAKCVMCNGTKRIKVDDYSVMRYRTEPCPICIRYEVMDQNRLYTYGRSLLIDVMNAFVPNKWVDKSNR